MEEPRPCNVPDSFTDAEKLAAYTNGTWDCKGPAASDSGKEKLSDSGEAAVSSSAASLFFTLLISFFAMQV
jgi:hypothetical protein